MKLYYKPGACSMSAHIVLNEIGAQFDLEKADTETGKTETGGDFRSINPKGYVPALATDEGEILTENPAILQFLADRAPQSGLAPAPGTIARVRLQEALNFISSELHKAFSPFFSGTEMDSARRKIAENRVGKQIAHIERDLEDGRAFLLGKEFSVADAYAFVVLNWSGFINLSLEAFPRTTAYVERLSVRPSVIRAMQSEGLIPQGQPA